jgi:hypothetical protein
MKTIKVECDACGEDLSETTNCEAYCLELANRRIPSAGGVVTLMAEYPALKRNFYFCGTSCLLRWMAASFDEKGSDVGGVTR